LPPIIAGFAAIGILEKNIRVYSITENLVLWARSEKFGCAVIQHSGMMEYWSVGIMGIAEWDLFL
jgi:hypothetical protein